MQYKRWMDEWETLTAEEIAGKLDPFMKEEDPAFEGLNFRKIFSQRLPALLKQSSLGPGRATSTGSGSAMRWLSLTGRRPLLHWVSRGTPCSSRKVFRELSVSTPGLPSHRAAYGTMQDNGRVDYTNNVCNMRILLSTIYRF
ncbi:MAG: hypothetical protein K0B05_02105 [Bacteroidales bacterium]|nr:hypothetical protein [Bacteroidales bacterium]